jgi:hypothetical protein
MAGLAKWLTVFVKRMPVFAKWTPVFVKWTVFLARTGLQIALAAVGLGL